MSVPLPPPDGELMTNRMPRSLNSSSSGALLAATGSSFNVLHLLAQFFRFRLDAQRCLFDRHVG